MDRMEEYKVIMAELENEPRELAGVAARAGRRAKRELVRRRIMQSAAGFAAMAACFVLAVNLCTPIALACGRVPILRELAQAVIVSPSLSAAVANEHVQLVGQEQTVNGYTVRLEYVIADKRQVNVFFTVEGEPSSGERLNVFADVTSEAPLHSVKGSIIEPGVMDYLIINFVEGETPEHLDLTVTVGETLEGAPELARCGFSLDLDPYLLSQGRTVEVNEGFELDGNTLTLSTVELYPTHMRLNVEQDEDNPDYLKDLELTIDGDGRNVERVDGKGTTATGGGRYYGTYSVYTASAWYYGCEELNLAISGATWLSKDRLETKVDPKNGTATGMPDGVSWTGSEKDPEKLGFAPEDGTILIFKRSKFVEDYYPFYGEFQDGDGNTYRNHSSVWRSDGAVYFQLGDCRGDAVTLMNAYSHIVTFDEPLTLTVDVKE